MDAGVIVTDDYIDRVLNYDDDALTLGSEGLILDDNLVIKVDGDIELRDVTVGGRIEIQASGTITVTSLNAGSGVVYLESTDGDVIVHSLDASSSSDVTLKATERVHITDLAGGTALTAQANLDVDAETILVDGEVIVGGNIDLDAEANLTINGTLDAGGNVSLNAYYLAEALVGESLQINGTVNAGGTVTVDAGDESISIIGTVIASSDVVVHAGGSITLGADGMIQSTASFVDLTAVNGDLLLDGDVSAAQSIDLITGAALSINGTVDSNTEVIMEVATTLLINGQVKATDQIVADAVGAITIEGTLRASALIDLYTDAELTLGAAALLEGLLSGESATFIRLDAYKVLEEATGSQVNGITELRITESIANLEWDVHGSTTWTHVEDNPDLLALMLNGNKVLLVSDTALLGEPAEAAYSLTDPSGAGEATDVFLYALTVEVVTDLGTGEQTIHFTAELLTNSELMAVEPVGDFDNIVSVTSTESLDHVDGLLGIEMTLVEIDPSGTANYPQALYSLLTRNS